MAGTNQFLPFATGAGANGLTVAQYNALAARQGGFVAGLAKSIEVNTAFRQASTVAAMIGQFIADLSGNDANDDGNIPVLERRFRDALLASLTGDAGASLVHYGLDISTNANLLNVQTITPPVPAMVEGMLFEIVPLRTNTSGVVASIATNPAVSVFRRDGTPLLAGDIVVGVPFLGIYYGGAIRALGFVKSDIIALTTTLINNLGIVGSTVQDYNSPGSYSWTAPASSNAIQLQDVIGGGGGGGGANDVTSAASAGAGGGHGQGLIVPVTPGEILTIIVPAGGQGGAGGTTPQDGTAGGTAQIRRANGTVIAAATGGNGGKASTSGVQPIAALGGISTGCYSNDPGVTGGLGYPSASRFVGGIGGACPSGGGGSPGPNYSDVGKPGLNYGGGGNGSSANGAGGNGAGGRVRFNY